MWFRDEAGDEAEELPYLTKVKSRRSAPQICLLASRLSPEELVSCVK